MVQAVEELAVEELAVEAAVEAAQELDVQQVEPLEKKMMVDLELADDEKVLEADLVSS